MQRGALSRKSIWTAHGLLGFIGAIFGVPVRTGRSRGWYSGLIAGLYNGLCAVLGVYSGPKVCLTAFRWSLFLLLLILAPRNLHTPT